MANRHIDNLNAVFEKLPAMDSEYAKPERPGGVFRLPSHRSGFAAADDTASDISSNATGDAPWSPPAWRPPESSSAWYRHQPYLQESPIARSSGRVSASVNGRRSESVADEDDTLPANIPLPRGSESPRKELSPEPQGTTQLGTRQSSPDGENSPDSAQDGGDTMTEKLSNYIRFSVRADVQQRTEPLEQAIVWIKNTYAHVIASKRRLFGTIALPVLFVMLLQFLFSPPSALPRPDLIKVAAFARGFEPLVHFSEHGVRHLSDLQDTGTAVWDLGESVRIANFTSAPIIVKELESLYDSLTGLATELTGFFATVDGDFDNILLVMDWARRELVNLESTPATHLSNTIGNLHHGLASVGLLSASNPSDVRNVVFASVFGVPSQQRAQATLKRTFTELVGALEASVASELQHAQALFSLYAAIDRQLLNLQRMTARETDAQEAREFEVLSSLWQRALGAKAGQLRKFERNKSILSQLKGRTVFNKGMLLEHNSRLMALKQNLEIIRRRLVSPLLKIDESATMGAGGWGLEEQVKELEATGEFLKGVRQEQKTKVMDTLYGASRKKAGNMGIEGI